MSICPRPLTNLVSEVTQLAPGVIAHSKGIQICTAMSAYSRYAVVAEMCGNYDNATKLYRLAEEATVKCHRWLDTLPRGGLAGRKKRR